MGRSSQNLLQFGRNYIGKRGRQSQFLIISGISECSAHCKYKIEQEKSTILLHNAKLNY